jgi:hypothetical protein
VVTIVLDIEHHPLPWSASGEYLELGDDPESAWHLWTALLLLCLGDRAESLHYHSWRGADALACICNGTRHSLEPPWPPLAAHLAGVWLDRLGGRPWWPKRHRSAVGWARTLCGGLTDDWYVSCWSLQGAEGVDLYRAAPAARCDRAYWLLYRDADPKKAEPLSRPTDSKKNENPGPG